MGRHRFLLGELVRRDVEQRYRSSALGLLWSLLEPAWQLALFTFVFGLVLQVRLPGEATDSFPIFLFAGLLAWIPVRQGVERSATAIVASAPLIKNHRLRAALFPLALVISETIHGLVATALFVVVLAAIGSLSIASLPLLLLAVPAQAALALGLALGASATRVYVRDVERGVAMLVSVAFYATPVVYPIALVPDAFRRVIALNPLTGLVELYRAALLGGRPEATPLAALAVGTTLLLAVGWVSFRWLEPGFVDEL